MVGVDWWWWWWGGRLGIHYNSACVHACTLRCFWHKRRWRRPRAVGTKSMGFVPPSLGRSRCQHQLLLGGRGRCGGGQRGRLRLWLHRCSANGAQERPRHGQSVAWRSSGGRGRFIHKLPTQNYTALFPPPNENATHKKNTQIKTEQSNAKSIAL